MPTRTSSKTMARFEEAPQSEKSLGQASAEFPDEWLLFGVTRFNDRREPTHGYVLYHHLRESVVASKIVRFATAADKPYSGGVLIMRSRPELARVYRVETEPA